MSTLYLRGKSVWIAFTDQFGTYRRRRLGVEAVNGVIPKDAHRLKQKIDVEVANHTWGLKNDIRRITLSELRDEFVAFIGGVRDPQTVYLYKLAVKQLIEYIGDVPIATITQETISEFRDRLTKDKSAAKASQTLRSLSPMFQWAAVHNKWIPFTPINRYNRVTLKRKTPQVYSDEELQKFFTWLFDTGRAHFLRQIQFLLLTGFRLNESCTLTWDKVDIANGVIFHYDDKKDEWLPYPMDDTLQRFMKNVPREGEFVFHYRSKHSLGKIMSIAREAGVIRKGLKIHSLKTTYIRNLISAGLSTTEIHKLAHHRSYATTDYYYSTFQMDHLRDALKKSRRVKGVQKLR